MLDEYAKRITETLISKFKAAGIEVHSVKVVIDNADEHPVVRISYMMPPYTAKQVHPVTLESIEQLKYLPSPIDEFVDRVINQLRAYRQPCVSRRVRSKPLPVIRQ